MNKKNIYKCLGKNIRRLRKSKNMTQEELSQIIGVSKTAVVNYENGQRKISLDLLIKISDFYNVSLDKMIDINLEDDTVIITDNVQVITFLQRWKEKIGGISLTDNEIDILIDFSKFILKNRSVK